MPVLRSASRISVVLFCVVSIISAGFLAGCNLFVSADSDGNGIPDPVAPAYVDIAKSLGIWGLLEKSAMTLPPYLYDLPGVDGEGPFEVEVQEVPYKETPQRTLTLNIHRPITNDNKLRRAVVLYMGGGFLVDLDFPLMEVWADYMASRGLVVFNARQRLITEPNVTQYNAFSDAFAAVRFIGRDGPKFGADPERIAVMGRSSGGHLSLMVGMFPDPDLLLEPTDPDAPVKVKAMVDIYGPVDYARLATGEDFSIVPAIEFVAGFGCYPDQCPEDYTKVAPISYVRPGLPAALIVHGNFDFTVPQSQSIGLADALEAAGNVVEREFQIGTGHVIGWGFVHNDGFGHAMMRIVRFLESRL